MLFEENASFFAQARVIPVLTPLSVVSGVAISDTLSDAGLRMQEITLRNAAAVETIAAIRQEVPKLIVGAGSVLTPMMGELAIKAGAQFLVSPGTDGRLLQFAAECGIPFLPGVATVGEIMNVLARGFTAAKLFPAEPLGGVRFLQAVAGPLPSMRFCPTGGIDAQLAPGYLRLPNVLAVGGSWMVPTELASQNRLEEIGRLARIAAEL